MGLYANNMVIQGRVDNLPIYANTISASSYSNVSVESDLSVNGEVFVKGRMDVGRTIYSTFRLTSNMSFVNANNLEMHATSNAFVMDMNYSDIASMSGISMAVPPYLQATGQIHVPVSGLYTIQLQASFSNVATSPMNGVYLYLQSKLYPDIRIAPVMTSGPLVSTSFTGFLSAGDIILPTFYSNDANATLIGTSDHHGETFVSYCITATTS